MPARSLPDDMNQWPTDPFRLLGIGRRANSRDARRAYVKLIRHFKPEHSPQQFQRIREAFECVQRQIKVREMYRDDWLDDDQPSTPPADPPADPPDDDVTLATDAEADQAVGPADQPLAAEDELVFRFDSDPLVEPPSAAAAEPARIVPADDVEQRCDAAWQLAQAGQEREAYRRLREMLSREGPPSEGGSRSDEFGSPRAGGGKTRGAAEESICVRLYWLLAAMPELDPARVACDWLARALRASRLSGPAMELYRREIGHDRNEALSPRCSQLLDGQYPVDGIAELVDCRWRAVSFLRRWDVIVDDLPRVRAHVVFDDETTWGRLLLLALDQLAWFREHPVARNAFEHCRREIDQLSHLHSALDRDLDQMDLLLELVEGWRRMKFVVEVPAAWNDLVPLSWTQLHHDVRPHLLPILQQVAERPLAALEIFDRIVAHSSAVASQLGSLFQRARYYDRAYDDNERTWDDAERHSRRFFQLHPLEYRQVRRQLLQFCVDEVIDPQQVARAADELIGARQMPGGGWTESLAQDGPVRFVYAGVRSFWG